MNRDISFGTWECTCILVSLLGTKVILNYPRDNVELTGTAGWLLALYTGLLALGLLFLLLKLYKPFAGKDIVEIGEIAAGLPGRILTGLSIVAVFIVFISFNLRQFGELMITMAFTKTPISFIHLFFVIGMVVAAYLGLETIVRFQAIFVPISIGAFLLYLIGLGPYYQTSNLFPILGNGPYTIFIKGASRISGFAELIALFLLAPYVKKFQRIKTAGWLSVIGAMFFMFTITGAYIAVADYPASLRSFLPAYELGRTIDYARFFENVEAIMIITWATMAYMYLSCGLYFIVNTFARTFKIQYYKPLIPAFTVIIFVISLLPSSLMLSMSMMMGTYINYAWIVTFALPFLLLLIARRSLKGKKGKNPQKSG